MTKLTLQFHATRDEASVLLHDWAHDLDANLLVECFWPEYSAVAEHFGLLRHPDELPSDTSRLCLNLYAMDETGASGNDTIDKNPDSLTLLLGTRTPDGVRASMLGASTEDPASLTAWKKVRTRARKSMKKGAWVVNPASGERKESPSHLYTPQAEQLVGTGAKLLAGAGGNYYEPFSR